MSESELLSLSLILNLIKERGSLTVSQLAQITSLNRNYIHAVLDKMSKIGILKKHKYGNIVWWTARSVDKFVPYRDEVIKALAEIVCSESRGALVSVSPARMCERVTRINKSLKCTPPMVYAFSDIIKTVLSELGVEFRVLRFGTKTRSNGNKQRAGAKKILIQIKTRELSAKLCNSA